MQGIGVPGLVVAVVVALLAVPVIALTAVDGGGMVREPSTVMLLAPLVVVAAMGLLSGAFRLARARP